MQRILSIILISCIVTLPAVSQTATISGKIIDSETGEPLVGANILVFGTALGSTSDRAGEFWLKVREGAYQLRASFIGYIAQEALIELESGETYVWNITLTSGADLNPVQVTAGRRNEKALDAPASIDVITANEIESDISLTTARSLRNVTGLDMVQTGVDRYEIALRGFNNVFSRSTHVLTDYRKAGAASIGVNLHNVMPNLAIDIERIEVVRGPGSALYGPGVDSGVIHYISKNPFNNPGTTISVSGGQRSSLNLQGRFATVLGNNVGVKLIGSYARADDFTLQECDVLLLEQERFSECPDEQDAIQLFVDGPRESMQRKFVVYGSVDLRISRQTNLSFNGGLSHLNGTMLSSIGTVQAKDMIASYGQIRLTSGPLFVQAYINTIDSRDSYIYGGGLIGESSEETTFQAQYTKDVGSRQEFIGGIDLTLEHIDKFGAYVQSTTAISNKLDLTLALRGDFNNAVTDLHLSPRAGLVFQPTHSSSLRLTYNRSLSSPLATDYFLNLIAATIGDLKVRARGGATGFTYQRDPQYLELGAPTSLVASSMLPGREGLATPVGIDTGYLYALIYERLVALPVTELERLLRDAGRPLSPILIESLRGLLSPEFIKVQGFSPGILGLPNLSTLMIEPSSELNQLTDVDPIKPSITQSWEIGYKGLINRNVLFAIDGYYARRKNFIGPLQAHTPFVLIPNLQDDLIQDLATGLNENEQTATLLGLVGLTPEEVAELIVDLAADDLPDSETPVAVVQPNENNNGAGNFPELMLAFPNFGNIQYFGMDLSLQMMIRNRWMLFGNASWVSDDFFDRSELGEELRDIELALNAPAFKFKLGGQYQNNRGLSMMISGRYTSGFPVIAGQYIGHVDPYAVIDVGLGYMFHQRGIRFDVGVNNLLNSQHREFVGAPRLGRVVSFRLTYTTER